MASKYKQTVNSGQTHFTKAPMGELEFSKWHNKVRHLTTFNAGDIVPILCLETLPHDTFNVSLESVIRQATVSVPTMDILNADFYAFFVPNRVVNKSWKNVMGENSSGAWANTEEIVLAPLGRAGLDVKVPVGSVADYYGYPTQGTLTSDILMQMHDLKLRGYLEVYNCYFRDQNYQPPIPYSKLNLYNGFFDNAGTYISLSGVQANNDDDIPVGTTASGQYPYGAVVKEVFGDGGETVNQWRDIRRRTSFSALDKPLKANKLHDYFTSVLPSPQKGREVVVPLSGNLTLNTVDNSYAFPSGKGLNFLKNRVDNDTFTLFGSSVVPTPDNDKEVVAYGFSTSDMPTGAVNVGSVVGTNLVVEQSGSTLSIDDLRMSASLQQVYEILGRGGSRYTEYINSFFGLDIDNPFDDIPSYLGHIRFDLDLYQTAQTSATQDGVGTPQGTLSAFGYTNKGGHMFDYTFKEHGYLHIMCVVRQKNTYSSMLGRDNFRMSLMDFYQYPLANITEQPVYTREINPFASDKEGVFGYNEAWAEYRMIPDRVSGYLRPGIELSLDNWNYADDYDSTLSFANGEWLKSNAQEVVSRTTALADYDLPQFKGQFFFDITMQRPMPTYSVAGLDVI